jgi:hypothetical protein
MNTSTCPPRRAPNSSPLPPELRRDLSALVGQVGESRARQIAGVSRGAFARALAGLGVYPGTVALIRIALDQQRAQIPDSDRGQP